jgi:hypothetical protein
MATSPGIAKVTFGVQDTKGQRGKISLWLYYYSEEPPEGFIHSLCDPDFDLQEYLQFLAVRLDGFIKGKVVSISYTVTVPLPGGLKAFPDVDSDCEEGAAIEYATDQQTISIQTVPTFNHEIFGTLSELRTLDGTPIALQEWVGYQVNPEEQVTEWRQLITDNRGVDLSGWNVVKRIFRPRRKDRN